MKPTLILSALAALVFTGCYTQLASGGHARRSVEPAYGHASVPADSVEGDSVVAEGGADSLYREPQTIIVNNYWRESPYYRGYAIDAWDYPGFTLGFYSTGYRNYHGPYWWDRGHGYRRDHRYHGGYGGGYRGGGGGTVVTGPSGDYKSDKRIFSPETDRPETRKGRRSETVPAPAPAQEPAPKASEPAPAPSASYGNSDDGDSGSKESKSERPRPQKGKRR